VIDPLTTAEVTLTVNGRRTTQKLPVHFTLLRWLREAGFVDVRAGCGEGVCGTCTVLVQGRAVSACLVLPAQVDGADVLTAVGLTAEDGTLGDLQRAFLERGAVQCGFCTSGMLLAAAELLDRGEPLDRNRVAEALDGNLCRCTGYDGIIEAILVTGASRRGAAG
jgi:aerobic carbon-monoxide dehydrogenase small subunit